MLVKCPECELQVSDKARSCPHCGYPLLTDKQQDRRPRQNKRRRLPNGFGQISEIKGKGLRKPFRAMVTIGKTEEGKPICKLLKPQSYFESYNDAYAALIDYNRNPYDLSQDLTMNDLFKKWLKDKLKTTESKFYEKNRKCAWKHCAPLHNMKVREIRTRHMKAVLADENLTEHNIIMMKTVLNQMLDYAVEYEIIEHNYARDFSVPKPDHSKETNTGSHIGFTDEEMDVIWSNEGKNRIIDMILIQCYTGFRPNELCQLAKTNIDINEKWIIGGGKTKAGTNRRVPIHPKILHLVKRYYENGDSVYLFKDPEYENYRKRFHTTIKHMGLDKVHTPHDCRVRFVTMAKNAGCNEYAIKRIVGHVIEDLTERVYTKRDFSWIREELEKIK